MRMFHPSVVLVLLMSVASLTACGNKGNLVKPTPPATEETPDTKPDASDAAQKPRAPEDAAQKTAQDSGGH